MARKKIYPTLWWLFRDNLLPDKTYFLGYARSNLNIKEFLETKSYEYMKVKPSEKEKFEKFLSINHYLSGSYDQKASFVKLNEEIDRISNTVCTGSTCSPACNRIFYLALPPSVYTSVTELLSHHCKAAK